MHISLNFFFVNFLTVLVIFQTFPCPDKIQTSSPPRLSLFPLAVVFKGKNSIKSGQTVLVLHWPYITPALYYTGPILHRSILDQSILHQFTLHWSILHRSILHWSILHRSILHWSILHQSIIHQFILNQSILRQSILHRSILLCTMGS